MFDSMFASHLVSAVSFVAFKASNMPLDALPPHMEALRKRIITERQKELADIHRKGELESLKKKKSNLEKKNTSTININTINNMKSASKNASIDNMDKTINNIVNLITNNTAYY